MGPANSLHASATASIIKDLIYDLIASYVEKAVLVRQSLKTRILDMNKMQTKKIIFGTCIDLFGQVLYILDQ